MDLEEKNKRLREYVIGLLAGGGGLESVTTDAPLHQRINEAPAPEEFKDTAARALNKLREDAPLQSDEAFALEAIVLPRERPAVSIHDGHFERPAAPFEHLYDDAATRERIDALLPAIGRIGVPGRPELPFAGTGFLVGANLLMTNRHVAELFASGVGRGELDFLPGQSANIDFNYENPTDDGQTFRIRKVCMVHPYWDMALLEVEGFDGKREPLTLATTDVDALGNREVAVIGYPARDYRNDQALQTRIFGGNFNIKRLQPGRLKGLGDIESFSHQVDAVIHDCSTLGGNSGSAVADVSTGLVVGLHFAGIYLKANYAVPAYDLAQDPRVVDAGVKFQGPVPKAPTSWDSYWLAAGGESAAPAATASRTAPPTRVVGPGTNPPPGITVSSGGGDGSSVHLTIPLEVTIRLGQPLHMAAVPAESAAAGLERMVSPAHDTDYDDRKGYDEDFLGATVKLPRVKQQSAMATLADGSCLLRYGHFSIVVHKARRLAAFTASNVDYSQKRRHPEPGRNYSRAGLSGLGKSDQELWFTDPRIAPEDQLPDKFYTRDGGAWDKGHIVRRQDAAWGDTYDELRQANGDTYHTTNCSPQVKDFNRSNLDGEWGELENYVQAQGKTERLSLFSGPILADDDPFFDGKDDSGNVHIRVPRAFWKLVVANGEQGLQSFAFLLEQDLSAVPTALEFAVTAEWQRRMVAVSDLEARIGLLTFPAAVRNSDQYATGAGESVRRFARLPTLAAR